jgi:hypothetical protein
MKGRKTSYRCISEYVSRTLVLDYTKSVIRGHAMVGGWDKSPGDQNDYTSDHWSRRSIVLLGLFVLVVVPAVWGLIILWL